jgi:hypothetical protein
MKTLNSQRFVTGRGYAMESHLAETPPPKRIRDDWKK